MSSFLCFICHSSVDSDTNEEIREKYREVIGMNLCSDSHLCHICCHILNKLTWFRSICLKRSLEYPVLFREKGTLNLKRTDIDLQILCTEDECQAVDRRYNQFNYNVCISNGCQSDGHDYIKLEKEYDMNTENISLNIDAKSERECCDFNDENKDYKETDVINDNEEIKEYSNNDNISDFNDEIEDSHNFNEEIESSHNFNEEIEGSHNFNEEIEGSHNFNEQIEDSHNFNEQIEDSHNFNEAIQNSHNIEYTEDKSQDEVEIKGATNPKKHKIKKSKKKGFEKIILSIEQQKAELEVNRKEKKYLESEFKCYNCALGFLFKDTYQTHMMRHEESNGEYRCILCTLRFASHSVLRSHSSLHSERYQCGRCAAVLRPRARAKHTKECSRGHTSDHVACHLCASLFKDASGLQQHIRRVHSRSGRVYPCSVCGETCRNQAAVRTHMLKHLKKKFSCEQCPAIYSSPYTLNQHKKKHELIEERHFCSCGMSYSSRKSLMAHRRNSLNHQQTVFECSKCSRVLPHRKALEAHENKTHSKATPLPRLMARRRLPAERRVCHLCGKSFKGNSKLNRHLKEVCEKEKDEQSTSLYE